MRLFFLRSVLTSVLPLTGLSELQDEWRNSGLFDHFDLRNKNPDRVRHPHPDIHPHWTEGFWNVTLPAGTVLSIDRIYIRKGVGDFDSVTFFIKDCPDKSLAPKKMKGKFVGSSRFWTKLHFANQIDCEIIEW